MKDDIKHINALVATSLHLYRKSHDNYMKTEEIKRKLAILHKRSDQLINRTEPQE